MKRKLISLMVASLVAIMITSTVFARSIKFSGITFSLGSLIAQGTLTGLGNQDVTVELDASGFPVVTCTNQGGNQAPGQNPPKISASGQQQLIDIDLKKNGTSPFKVETENSRVLDAIEYGCPNNNWTAQIDFVYWTDATIRVIDTASEQVLLSQDYTCTTTSTTVSCTPVR